jgi:hypothetical protein
MATFKYAGKADALYVQTTRENVRLEKGREFTTEDAELLSQLRGHPDVTEVKPEEKRDDKKPPRKSDGAQ